MARCLISWDCPTAAPTTRLQADNPAHTRPTAANASLTRPRSCFRVSSPLRSGCSRKYAQQRAKVKFSATPQLPLLAQRHHPAPNVIVSIFSSDLSPNAVVGVRTGLANFTVRERSAILDDAGDKNVPFGKTRPRELKIPSGPAWRFDGAFDWRRSGAFKDRQNDRQMVWLWRNPTSGEN